MSQYICVIFSTVCMYFKYLALLAYERPCMYVCSLLGMERLALDCDAVDQLFDLSQRRLNVVRRSK